MSERLARRRLVAVDRHRLSMWPLIGLAFVARLGAVLLLWLAGGGLATALVGGAEDDSGRFPAVVSIRGPSGGLCTATKIGARSFLTAAHCVVDRHGGGIPTEPTILEIHTAATPQGPAMSLRGNLLRVLVAPEYERGLRNFARYRQERLALFGRESSAPEPSALGRALRIGHHFSARFPDVAILVLDGPTPEIPTLEVDLRPLSAKEEVVLVGFGCRGEQTPSRGAEPVRAAGSTQVLRVDSVNFYTAAAQMAPGAPSLCPGDSGGPVLRAGRVVGVHGVVYGLHRRHGARSNMAVNLSALAEWTAWEVARRDGVGETAVP